MCSARRRRACVASRLPPCAGPTGRPARNPLATLALLIALALAAAHGAVAETLGPWAALGVDVGASEEEVTRAFRALAREHHPDKVRDVVRASKAGGSRQRARASSGHSSVSAARACAGSDSHTPAGAPLVARTSRDLCARGCFAPSHAAPRACCRRAVTPTASSRFVQPMRSSPSAAPTGKARVGGMAARATAAAAILALAAGAISATSGTPRERVNGVRSKCASSCASWAARLRCQRRIT